MTSINQKFFQDINDQFMASKHEPMFVAQQLLKKVQALPPNSKERRELAHIISYILLYNKLPDFKEEI